MLAVPPEVGMSLVHALRCTHCTACLACAATDALSDVLRLEAALAQLAERQEQAVRETQEQGQAMDELAGLMHQATRGLQEVREEVRSW